MSYTQHQGGTNHAGGLTGHPSASINNAGNVTNHPSAGVLPPAVGTAALPLWHTSQNFDLSNNSTVTDLMALGTWKNAGFDGATFDVTQATAGNKPRAKQNAIGTKWAAECVDAARTMGTGAFTTIPQPYQVAFVWRATEAATQIVNTGAGSTPQIYTVVGPNGHLNVNSGGGAQDTGLAVSANTFHMAVINLNGAASVARLDGVASSAFNPGSTGLVSTFNLCGVAGLGIIGFLVEHLVFRTPQIPSDIEAYFTAQYGGFPQ